MSTACWQAVCPVCLGKGKIKVWDKKAKTIHDGCECPGCDGKGFIFVKKTMVT